MGAVSERTVSGAPGVPASGQQPCLVSPRVVVAAIESSAVYLRRRAVKAGSTRTRLRGRSRNRRLPGYVRLGAVKGIRSDQGGRSMVACLRIGNAQQRRSAGHRGQGPTGLRDRGAGWNPPPSLRPGHGRAVLRPDRPAGRRRLRRSPGCHPVRSQARRAAPQPGTSWASHPDGGMRPVRRGRQAVVLGQLCQRRRGLGCWAALAGPSAVVEVSSRKARCSTREGG